MEKLFITGGAGFLGCALLKWAQGKADVTVYSRDEAKHGKARRDFPDCRFIIGDVRDYDRLELAMVGHDIVIHAAAMKHVPQGESNVAEAVAVNIDGSRNVAKAAIRNGVKQVIGISTDKACRPVNVYGLTKLVMERLFQEADRLSPTEFKAVRYGNVIGSTGSVIPIFQERVRNGKAITITDPTMTRFWLSVDDGVALVSEAMVLPTRGTVLVPRLPSCTMRDVAEAVAVAEDLDGNKQAIEIIGRRFGEKVHEDLLAPTEAPYTEMSGEAMEIFPVVNGQREQPVSEGYSSDDPDDHITPLTLAKMIRNIA